MPFYELDLVCPIEWPLHPNYPIDNVYVQPATSPVVSTSTPFTEEVPEVTIDWLRSLYLDCLYSLDKLKDVRLRHSLSHSGVICVDRCKIWTASACLPNP
jgi:hypothetical protein